jgi:hypothetical protein
VEVTDTITNTVIYYGTELITVVKSFMIQAPGIISNSESHFSSLKGFFNFGRKFFWREKNILAGIFLAGNFLAGNFLARKEHLAGNYFGGKYFLAPKEFFGRF